jgi:hypothetical protein
MELLFVFNRSLGVLVKLYSVTQLRHWLLRLLWGCLDRVAAILSSLSSSHYYHFILYNTNNTIQQQCPLYLTSSSMLQGTLSSQVRLLSCTDGTSTDAIVGLPIGLGAISGIITGRTSRSNWYTVSARSE